MAVGQQVDREKIIRIAGSIGATAIGYIGGRLNDTIGLPFVYLLLLLALGLHLWGWWPEIQKIAWLQRRERKIGSALLIVVVVVAGGWAAFYFQPPPEPPRVRIIDHSLYPVPRWKDFRIRVHYINDGPDIIRAPVTGTGRALPVGRRLSKDEEDKIFEAFAKERPDPNDKTERAQGATGLVTSPSDVSKRSDDLTQETIDEARKKKALLYIFASVKYFRGNTNEIWRTESCKYWDLRLPDDLIRYAAPRYCIGHNGTYGPFK